MRTTATLHITGLWIPSTTVSMQVGPVQGGYFHSGQQQLQQLLVMPAAASQQPPLVLMVGIEALL
jgi:hypothetical protein